MTATLEFVALFVPDLKRAEEYYRTLFEMEVITREAPREDGYWYALPERKDWQDLENAGIEIGMLAVRRDNFVLALFLSDPVKGQVFAFGLSMTPAQIDSLHSRITMENVLRNEEGSLLHFRDIYDNF